MKKLFVLSFLVVMFSGAVSAITGENNSKVVGEWKFESPDAPYGYTKGSIVIEEKEGKLSGYVKFSDGYKVDMKNASFSDGVLKSGIYIDYELVKLEATLNGNKMKGTADSSEGKLSFTAQKVEKE